MPLVAYLAHDSCKETGSIFEIGAGFIAKLRWQRSEGNFFDLPYTVEDVAKNWERVTCFNRNNEYPTGAEAMFSKINENIERIEENKKKQAPPPSAPAAVGSK